MSGAIINFPSNGASNWTDFVSIATRHLRGHCQMSMSSMSAQSVAECKVQAGSSIEVGGSIYIFGSEEAGNATSWSAISSATSVYMQVVPAGSVCTIEYTSSAPTYSHAKCGYYDGNDRYFAWLRKDSTAGYRYKHYMPQTFEDPVYFTNIIEIGEWNMNSTALKQVPHELGEGNNIQTVAVQIRQDGFAYNFDFPHYDHQATSEEYIAIDDTDVRLTRGTDGTFDAVQYQGTASTVANRGWVTARYIT